MDGDSTDTPASPWLIGRALWHFIPLTPWYPADLPFLKLATPSLKGPGASKSAFFLHFFSLCLRVPSGVELGAGVPTFPPQSRSPQEPSAGTGTRIVYGARGARLPFSEVSNPPPCPPPRYTRRGRRPAWCPVERQPRTGTGRKGDYSGW